VVKLSLMTGLALAVLFYAVMLAGVAVMGRVIWWMARNYPQRPSLKRCMVLPAMSPRRFSSAGSWRSIRWSGCARWSGPSRCFTPAICCISVFPFLGINKEEGLSFASSTLAIGVLVLEVLLAITVILWGYGYRLF
jgi:hypothetical protein